MAASSITAVAPTNNSTTTLNVTSSIVQQYSRGMTAVREQALLSFIQNSQVFGMYYHTHKRGLPRPQALLELWTCKICLLAVFPELFQAVLRRYVHLTPTKLAATSMLTPSANQPRNAHSYLTYAPM